MGIQLGRNINQIELCSFCISKIHWSITRGSFTIKNSYKWSATKVALRSLLSSRSTIRCRLGILFRKI